MICNMRSTDTEEIQKLKGDLAWLNDTPGLSMLKDLSKI